VSFYVDHQIEALHIGMSYIPNIDKALLKMSIDELREHPDVTVKEEKVGGLLVNWLPEDEREKALQTAVTVDVKDAPFIVGSAPFRSGYDVWAWDRATGMGKRIGP